MSVVLCDGLRFKCVRAVAEGHLSAPSVFNTVLRVTVLIFSIR